MAKDVVQSMGPVECRVVSFVADNPYRKRFVYRGCFEKIGGGRRCKQSLKGPVEFHCPHNALARGCFKQFYQFEVVLSDDSLPIHFGKSAIHAKIFEAVEELFYMPASC